MKRWLATKNIRKQKHPDRGNQFYHVYPMSADASRKARCVALVTFGVFNTGLLLLQTGAEIDADQDGMGDVWQQSYRISDSQAHGDLDGDRQTNLSEAQAGTNPHDSNSHSYIHL